MQTMGSAHDELRCAVCPLARFAFPTTHCKNVRNRSPRVKRGRGVDAEHVAGLAAAPGAAVVRGVCIFAAASGESVHEPYAALVQHFAVARRVGPRVRFGFTTPE